MRQTKRAPATGELAQSGGVQRILILFAAENDARLLDEGLQPILRLLQLNLGFLHLALQPLRCPLRRGSTLLGVLRNVFHCQRVHKIRGDLGNCRFAAYGYDARRGDGLSL